MQTLGISDSTTRTEGRLKSLFWPSISSGVDVDYLAVQGYSLCSFVALLSAFFLFVTSQPVLAVVVFLFFYLGGVGVREHSRLSAALLLIFYVVDTLVSAKSMLGSPGGIILRVVITALLFSNLRATWIASQWQPGSEEAALPARLNDTWRDKFADQWPSWLWPKIKVLYFVFAIGLLLLTGVGLIAIATRASLR